MSSWAAPPGRLPANWLIAAVAALAAVAAITLTTVDGWVQPAVGAAFVAFIAVGELLRIALPGDRDTAPFAAAAATSYALLPAFNALPLNYGVPQVVSVVAIGIVIGSLPRAVTGHAIGTDDVIRRIISVAVLAAVFRPILHTTWFDAQRPDWRLAVTMTAAALLAGVVDILVGAMLRASRNHAPIVRSIIDEARALVGLGLAITATAVLIALAAPVMGYWALPVFSLPLMLTQFSFRRYADIRTTYSQTIRALSRVTEVGGLSETGHARRVSRLSVMVGREMGVSERDLLDLEYAALMHDIGLLSAIGTVPGGATTMSSPADQRHVAETGAAVVRETGVLDRVALIVERQADQFRPKGSIDVALPIESRIIKVINAYDDLVGATLEFDRKQRAVERLQLSTTREFDPAVVDTLTRIIERQAAYAEWGNRI